jgi:hypothetical protein
VLIVWMLHGHKIRPEHPTDHSDESDCQDAHPDQPKGANIVACAPAVRVAVVAILGGDEVGQVVRISITK